MDNSRLQNAYEAAQQLEKSGDIKGAVSAYKKIIQKHKDFRPAYINLGFIFFQNGVYRDALTCYERALALEKDYLVLFNIGSIYYRMQEYKDAVINLERSRKLNSAFPMAILVSGLCYSRMNNYRAAEKNFNEILVIWPDNRVALTALAIMYYNQGRNDESISFLNSLLDIDEENHRIRELKSAILFKSGDVAASAEEMKKVTQQGENYKFYNEFISTVPVEVMTDRYGSLDEKIETLRGQEGHENLISLSLCHLFKGETDTAIEYLYQAKKELNH